MINKLLYDFTKKYNKVSATEKKAAEKSAEQKAMNENDVKH